MTPDEFMYNYVATAQSHCALKAFDGDGTIYAITSLNYTFGQALQMGVDLLYAGLIDRYIIWCDFGIMF